MLHDVHLLASNTSKAFGTQVRECGPTHGAASARGRRCLVCAAVLQPLERAADQAEGLAGACTHPARHVTAAPQLSLAIVMHSDAAFCFRERNKFL